MAWDTEALRAEKEEEGGREEARRVDDSGGRVVRGPISGIWLTFNERWQTF